MTRFDAIQSDSPVQRGQRYLSTDPSEPLAVRELVVDRLVRDELGMLHIVLLDLERREISVFADQLESAIAEGWLVASESAELALA